MSDIAEKIVHISFDESQEIELANCRDFYKYKFLLNPTRLLILKAVYNNLCIASSELRKSLKIPWGSYYDHLKVLRRKGFIEVKSEFVNNCPIKTISISHKGRMEYLTLIRLLHTMFEIE